MKKFFNIVLLTIGLSFFNSCFIIDDDSYRLTLSSASEKMIVGESITLKATVSGFRTVTPEIEWWSKNPSIATVDNGVIEAVSEGETWIIAKIAYGIEARCRIIVTEDFTITFADKVFEAYCLKNFDLNKDRKISGTEANNVKKMDFRTDNIKSMDDISYFTNLESLQCSGSRHHVQTAFYELDFYTGALTSLDVSKNTKLKELYCHGNKLTSLNVSKNTNLEVLFCDQNQLESLNVSNSTKLRILDCRNNKLTSLDVSKNTGLEVLNGKENPIKEVFVWEGYEKNFKEGDLLFDTGVKFVVKE